MTPWLEGSIGTLGWSLDGPTALALLALALAFPWLAGRSWRRLQGRGVAYRGTVLALNGMAFLALAGLLVSPTLERPALAGTTLLTEGGDLAETPDGAFASPDAPPLDERQITRLASVDELPLRMREMGTLHVLGHGLDGWTWSNLPRDLAVTFEPQPLTGPTGLRWPRRIALGEPLTVQGTVTLPDREAVVTVQLIDPAGQPVAEASSRSGQTFSLETVPPAVGPLRYRLQLYRGETRFADEPVTVEVTHQTRGQVLVLQSAPSFDTRQLANWAADQAQPLLILSQVSRDRNLSQAINLEEGAPTTLSPALLARTDLALVDGRRWTTLTGGERALLLNAVREGLGLLLLADSTLAAEMEARLKSDLEGDPILQRLTMTPAPAREASWPRWPGSAPEIPLTTVAVAIDAPSATPMTVSESGETVEAWIDVGQGRAAISVLRERHRWLTGGDRGSFTRYWTHVLRSIGRADPDSRWLAPDEMALPRPGRALGFCATGGEAYRFEALSGGDPAPTTELVDQGWGLPLRCGVAWPAGAGWYRLSLLGPGGAVLDTQFVSVFASTDWRAASHAQRQAATQRRAGDPDTQATHPVRQPLSRWWAWSLLVMSLGVLWIERRLWELR